MDLKFARRFDDIFETSVETFSFLGYGFIIDFAISIGFYRFRFETIYLHIDSIICV